MLNAATVAELTTALTTSTDLVTDYTTALAAVPFIDGSELFNFFLGHQHLYQQLAAAVDGDGRPMFPTLNPTNADGTAAARFRRLNTAGYDLVPAKSLGAVGTNLKSYIGDSDGASVWSSAPQQIRIETVAFVKIGLFGYQAGAVLDTNRIRKITY
jgi:hypothetical protein